MPTIAARQTEVGAGPAERPTLTHPIPSSPGAIKPMMRIGPALLAASVVVVLAVPRLGRRPLWLDEAYTIGATRDLGATWRGTGGTMGLYYLLMWPVTQVSTDRVWVRLPSLVLAALAVVVIHEVGRLIGGPRVGAVAAGALSMTWFLARYTLEARGYTLALLLVSLSWLGLVGAVRARESTARCRWWRLFVAASLLAPLAHGLAALHFVSQLAAVALAPNRRRWLQACVPVGIGLVLEGFLLFGFGAGAVADWIEPLRWSQVRSFLHVLFGRGPALWAVGMLATVAAGWAVASYRRRPRGDDAWLQLVPVLWAAGVPLLIIGLSVVRPYAEPRYVLGALPGVSLLLGCLLARLRPSGLALLAGAVVTATLAQQQVGHNWSGKEDWQSLTDRIAAAAQDGDRVLMPSKLRPPFDYAWAEGADRPKLVPASPTNPLGEVRRFYDTAPGPMRSRLLADAIETVWYVDRDDSRRDAVEALLADPELGQLYEGVGPWVFPGELYLVRFEPVVTDEDR
jgi:hypothetical protein